MSAGELLQQSSELDAFRANGGSGWTVVYRAPSAGDSDVTYFSAFVSLEAAPNALADPAWDVSIGHGQPGFVTNYDNGVERSEYLRFGSDEGFEPLVVVQEHYGVRQPALPQLSEEFRLFHNLWVSDDGTELWKVRDDGIEELAARVSREEVQIRTPLLRQFQAARQLYLALYIDARQWVDGHLPDSEIEALALELADDEVHIARHAGNGFSGPDRCFTRLLGTRLIEPPPVEASGVWPFKPAQSYAEFIVAEDALGNPIRFTCEPNQLGNYYGKNPDAPHYLRPVYFSRTVLTRYYAEPDKYSIEDGYLSCGYLWGLPIDNDQPDVVMVFLGDLGTKLPEGERGHWLTHNVAPSFEPSSTAVRRAFLGQPVNPTMPDLAFRQAYSLLREQWRARFGWDLYREPEPGDAHVLGDLRVPLTDSQSEFDGQLLNLAKLLVDFLNESELRDRVSVASDAKGIEKLRAWLTASDYPHVDRDVEFLRRLQKLRSKSAAHRKGSDHARVLAESGIEGGPVAAVSALLNEGLDYLRGLSAHFGLATGEEG